ncbi:GntR family transcriptional regulator [Streptomyces sp. NPDC059650]|uniref:GntR family transcriptional regulator n=1 Tax=Streptomyces sp. NPDC059650 TaxID=3346896 RepID=UPI00369C9D33
MTGSSIASHGMRQLDRAYVMVHQHVTTTYRANSILPTTKELAARLHLPTAHVHQALRRLDARGVIAVRASVGAVRLSAYAPHPNDLALQGAVRDRIRVGYYRPGQAIPTGLLGAEFSLRSRDVQRALRYLTTTGVLHYDERGPFGPGHYVPAPTSDSKHRRGGRGRRGTGP